MVDPFLLMFRLALTVLLAAATIPLCAADKVEFNRDIRPILSDKCFHCHGFDPKTREADLRLDDRSAAIKGGHIVPGDASKSLIIQRALSHDADEVMPPPKSKLGRLSDAEIATLKQWVNEGAEYQAHWSFIPVAADAAKDKSIDSLVTAGLAARGLQLQPRADAATLIRRLSFDITGLPPTAEQVMAFTAAEAKDPGAINDLIDRLLASPAYGERMAVDWLDLSRYADSYGFQVDREREVWPWRDWVIGAFNDNLRFDDFITWQVAGDLLPNPSDDQLLATAFNRLHQQESEGGSVEEEYRVEYVADRVQTFATAFLGLTFECCRCHDHKYDPIKQTDYYGLFAMFQNIDEAGLYSFFTPTPPTPAMMLTTKDQKAKLAQLRSSLAELESKHRPAVVAPDLAQPMAHYAFDVLKKGKLINAIQADKPGAIKGENKLMQSPQGQAVLFSGDDSVDLAGGNFHVYEPFSVALSLKAVVKHDRAVVFHRSRAWTDAASRGYELLIEDGKLKWSLIHFWPGNAISIRARDLIPLDTWTQVLVTSDGSSKAAGLKLFVNGKQVAVDIVRDHLTRDITGGGGADISLGERFRDRGFKGGMIDDFKVYDRDLSDGTAPAALTQLRQARAALIAYTDGLKDLMIMQELPTPKTAYVLFRGEYDKRTSVAPPTTPSALLPLAKGLPNNRLGLAKWLVDPQHPLTARVTVNRIWQGLFGRGLVRTSEDFGSQGARPLYPELLDLLAMRFMQSGWDLKSLIKDITLSSVYQQRSIAAPATMADDPDNEWLARGPRFRLGAEMIRDNALAAAGLLDPQRGGPPVNPYEMTEAFKPANPTQVYRRSVYTNWRRTGPPPAMVAFDAPRRAVCSAKRERTDSPLQALILLNGTQYVEAARVLGMKLHSQAKGQVPAMITAGFLRCLSRQPDARELAICTALYEEQLAYYQGNPKAAIELINLGQTKPDSSVPAVQAAAATVLAQALLNHDACVVKR
jgi:Protein of unknown function (DUF1553)/Protein of unknown function (DUF1549)/Planctomycete cytochrome C/Concanavalin A-like lectin/glucanases superfamily